MAATSLFEDLSQRGLIHSASEGTERLLRDQKVTAYIGFDPSATSLHVGSLLPLLTLQRIQQFGHRPIAIAGGGTGLIGDPSGKAQERSLLSTKKAEHNLAAIKRQLEHFLDFRSDNALVLNNADWLGELSAIDFLRDIGKHFTVNYMLAKESIRTRFAKEQGISYTEFSYLLLQAWDFLALHDRYGCVLQMGGSDQWGNITAGIELIRRARGTQAYGLVFPLIESASGTKFGKTEEGAVWLDPELTPPFEFYQFWINTPDHLVVKFLKFFTFLSLEEIYELERVTRERAEQREAQKRLAQEVTTLVHGSSAFTSAERASQVLFGGGDLTVTNADELSSALAGVPTTQVDPSSDGLTVFDLSVLSGLTKSRREARRLLDSGGLYLNNQPLESNKLVSDTDLIGGQYLVLRKGPKTYKLLQLERNSAS